jgi:hypothetical protein
LNKCKAFKTNQIDRQKATRSVYFLTVKLIRLSLFQAAKYAPRTRQHFV